jgi:hypothetical protein
MYDTGLETARPSAVALLKPQGLVRNGLVAEYRFDESKNLLKYSQQFDTAWTKTDCAITANDAAAPDGTTTADKVTLTVGAAQSIAGTYTVVAATAYTYSIWVKLGTATALKYAIYDVSNSADIIAATSYGSTTSWVRYAIPFTTPAGCTSVSIRPVKDSAQDNGTTAWIWGAQLELGSVARTYVPTTDKQLLMDCSRPRRNLLLPNQANACEDGTTTGFSASGSTITASAGEVDEWKGTYCLKIVTNNAATYEGFYMAPKDTQVHPSRPHTGSLYIRGAAGGETVQVGLQERKDDGATLVTTTTENLTLTTEWQRVDITATFNSTTYTAGLRVYTQSQQSATFYVDGLQIEEGSIATAWEAPPNIGYCGSAAGPDTNDPTWTGQGLSHGADDYVAIGGIYNAAGTLQNGYGITIAFYTAEVTAATSKLCLVSLGANKGVYLGAVDAGFDNETITVQYSATSFTYATGTIAAGWHLLDLVWNGSQYEIWLDGTQRTGTDVGTPALLSLSAVKMRYDGTTYGSGLTGTYSLGYNRAPTVAERNQNRNYLWGYLKTNRGIDIKN